MKTLLIRGAMTAFLSLAVASLSAQTQTTTSTSTTYIQTSKLVGTKVKSSQGEEIGVIKDVVIDRNTGCMAYTVLSTGEGGARVARRHGFTNWQGIAESARDSSKASRYGITAGAWP